MVSTASDNVRSRWLAYEKRSRRPACFRRQSRRAVCGLPARANRTGQGEETSDVRTASGASARSQSCSVSAPRPLNAPGIAWAGPDADFFVLVRSADVSSSYSTDGSASSSAAASAWSMASATCSPSSSPERALAQTALEDHGRDPGSNTIVSGLDRARRGDADAGCQCSIIS